MGLGQASIQSLRPETPTQGPGDVLPLGTFSRSGDLAHLCSRSHPSASCWDHVKHQRPLPSRLPACTPF